MSNGQSVRDSDIAIVGKAGRFPGAGSVAEFWSNLRDGREAIRRYTDDELREAGVSDEHLKSPNYVKAGAPLDDMEWFDPGFFGFSPKDAAIMDPQHRQMLECAWEAFENAAIVPSRCDGAIGVFVGSGLHSYFAYNLLRNPDLLKDIGLFLLRHTGNDKDFLATRLSYCFDLRGPSINVQTACSTSLVAVHMASQSLLSGECDLALAGGVTIELPHRQGYLFRDNEILSPDGHCRAFDAASAGTVFGSGAGVVVLRRLEDAIENKDQIHAIIRATAINNDGSSKVGYLAPSVDGHAAVVEEALALADLPADSIDYIETHGTGTNVGDPIEVSALTQAFRQTTQRRQFCAIGSVKTNIGHLDTAAGVAGLIKTVEALRHQQLPPSLGFESPNPMIDFEASPFFVNTELRDWQSKTPRRAGISALGVGGTNAHVIVEEWPAEQRDTTAEDEAREQQLFVASGRSAGAARANALAYADWAHGRSPLQVADGAYTSKVGRESFEHRAAWVWDGGGSDDGRQGEDNEPQTAEPQLVEGVAPEEDRPVAFLFPGGGAQYAGMSRRLYETEPVYRDALDRCLDCLANDCGVSLRDLILDPGDEAEERLQSPDLAVTSLFSVEYALARLLRGSGIEPRAMIGHSMGEYVAATIAGVFSLEDALAIVALRGRLFTTLPPGGMLSVSVSAEEAQEILEAHDASGQLGVAARNSPTLSVVSGPADAITRLEELAPEIGVEARRVPIDVAAHSSMLDDILEAFREGFSGLELSPPQLPFLSNVTGDWITESQATDPEYWVTHLRSTVDFATGVERLIEDVAPAMVEVGPGTTLGAFVRQAAGSGTDLVLVPTLRHPKDLQDDRSFFLRCLGQLWVSGAPIDWSRCHHGDRRRIELPSYQFERQRYWIEPQLPAEAAQATLRRETDFGRWLYQPVWRASQRPAPQPDVEPTTYLVFVDQAGVGDRIADGLVGAGHKVVRVQEGDAFHRESHQRYRLPPELGQVAYDQLVNALRNDELLPDRVLHCWSVSPDLSHRRASNLFHQHQERGFSSLLRLLRALGAELGDKTIQMRVLANDFTDVGGRAPTAPGKATLLGPLQVAAHENPGFATQCIEVELGGASSEELGRLAHDVLEELSVPIEAPIVSLTMKQRLVQELERCFLQEDPRDPPRTDGTILVTGGLGDLALELATGLAEDGANLVLVGRSALPAEDEWEQWLSEHLDEDPTSGRIRRVQQLRQQGCQVMLETADVTDIQAMRRVVSAARRRFGRIDGVIHAAGVTDDQPILQKNSESIDRVLAPKLQGTLVLADVLADEPLDFLLLFGSTSAWIAPPGQADYAAATHFLNAWASAQPELAPNIRRTVALNWGAWAEAGLALRAARRLRGDLDTGAEQRHTDHPLLDRLVLGDDGTVLYGELNPSSNWFLNEHRLLDGRAVLPGTAHVELMLAALTELEPEERYELAELHFLSPMLCDGDRPRTVRIVIGDGDGDGRREVRLDSISTTESQWTTHSQSVAEPLQSEPLSPVDPDMLTTDLVDIAAVDLSAAGDQSEAFRFGPRWNVMRRVKFGEDAIAELELSPEFASEAQGLQAHPALLDLATGFALRLGPDYDPKEESLVPLSYDRIRLHESIPSRLFSRARLTPGREQGVLRFDIWLIDSEGRIFGEVEGITFRRLPRSATFDTASPAQPTSSPETYSESEKLFLETVEGGIQPEEGRGILSLLLASEAPSQLFVSPVDPESLRSRTEQALRAQASVKFERPELDSEFEAPSGPIEKQLARAFEDLLGVDSVGACDDFFALGGHSLIAVRLFARIKSTFGAEYPLSLLFEAPTVRLLATRLAADTGSLEAQPQDATQHQYLVSLHNVEATTKRPLFIVSGMLGNVLNLRYLSTRLGDDQRVYALQARGLYGEAEPHRRFDQMAQAYLAEVRSEQPEGPYFLGGFSGGGLIALEMARLLLQEGQQIGLLAMLDTPAKIPGLSWRDRLELQLVKWRQGGIFYPIDFIRQRLSWERSQRQEKALHPDLDRSPAVFRSAQIEEAFIEALDHYQIVHYPGKIHLFRPELDEAYRLSGGRVVNTARCFVRADNHWRDFSEGVEVTVVPGEHNSMVLEPHVRVLARQLRTALESSPGLLVGSPIAEQFEA